MVSMLCLGKGTPPPMLVCNPSILTTSRGTNLRFGLNRTSNSLTNGYARRHFLHPVICSVEESSTPWKNDNNNNNRKARGIAGASLILACAIGIISAGLKMNPKAIAGPREMYQKAPPPPIGAHVLGGKAALGSLLDVTVSLTSRDLRAPKVKYQLPPRPSIAEVNDIKMQAVKIMKNGKAEDAEEFLQRAYEQYKNDPEPAYFVEMALVELLICLGKYEKALECNCLREDRRLPSDGRFPLYKAIIHTMLDDKEEAVRWWDAYMDLVEGGFDPTNT